MPQGTKKVVVILLILSILATIIVRLLLIGSASPYGPCGISPSFLDPTGFFYEIYDKLYTKQISLEGVLSHPPCPLIIPPVTNYIWPFFYFFFDLNLFLLAFLILNSLFEKNIVKIFIYKICIAFIVLGIVYLILPMGLYSFNFFTRLIGIYD